MELALTILVWVILLWVALGILAGVVWAIAIVFALVKAAKEPHPNRALRQSNPKKTHWL